MMTAITRGWWEWRLAGSPSPSSCAKQAWRAASPSTLGSYADAATREADVTVFRSKSTRSGLLSSASAFGNAMRRREPLLSEFVISPPLKHGLDTQVSPRAFRTHCPTAEGGRPASKPFPKPAPVPPPPTRSRACLRGATYRPIFATTNACRRQASAAVPRGQTLVPTTPRH